MIGSSGSNVKPLFLLNQLHKCHANVSLLAVVQRQSDFLKSTDAILRCNEKGHSWVIATKTILFTSKVNLNSAIISP